MKISSEHSAADAKEKRRQGELGFTMIEIAMAIGVIGFALVAIIGILPAGMNVQQSNREDTLVAQDAPYFLDAIRNGCVLNTNRFGEANQNLDFLTNYVESIAMTNVINGVFAKHGTNYPSFNGELNFTSGSNIVGLLSSPQDWQYTNPSNYLFVSAIVRALSGPAVQQNGVNPATAFRYQMTVEILPFNSFAPDSTNYALYEGGDTNQAVLRYNRWLETTPGANGGQYGAGGLVFNLFDVRLHFSWPVLPNGAIGPNHQTYRAMIAAQLLPTVLANGDVVWFFQPHSYTNSLPSNFYL
jgi:type II secretory pathway pseudopilin PulG